MTAEPIPPSAQMVLALFAATLFCSSFLMFMMEPMIAKTLLPLLGGAPAVWNTCVMFFQVMLLAGYAVAHAGSRRLGTRWFSIVYMAMAVAGLAVLPFSIHPDAAASDATDHPILWTLRILTQAIAIPFLALSAAGPLLQWWFSRTRHHASRDPYFLYAASNVGSLIALLSYPALVEPALRMETQARIWMGGYVVFAVLTACCAAITWIHGDESATDTAVNGAKRARIPWRRRLYWVALAFIPSSLMLGVTAYVSTDIAAVPLLWILPLSLYLLSFIVAWRSMADRRLPVLVLPLAVFAILSIGGPVWLVLPMHLLAFTMTAVLCHGALAEDRPEPESLTQFYLWIALGGMLGGVFNSLIAPALFDDLIEYPLVLVLACFVRRGEPPALGHSASALPDQAPDASQLRARVTDVAYGAGIFAFALALALLLRGTRAAAAALVVPAAVALRQLKHPIRFAVCVAGLFLAAGFSSSAAFSNGRLAEQRRTFFGVYRVFTDASSGVRELYHGSTLHGMQAMDGTHDHEPLTYYHRTGPFGELFDAIPPAFRQDVGVVGLGVGSLAAYAEPNATWTFYEIDPAVERFARDEKYFTHLAGCGNRCRVVLGDARIQLAAASGREYGLLILDAFSSDAIPTHLMTSEAMSLYGSRLARDGVLAFHISNRHLRLGPVLGRLAAHHGFTALERVDTQRNGAAELGKRPSNWLVMARDARSLGRLTTDSNWKAPAVTRSTPLWTDDFTNILSVFKLR